jgi:TetR/AcrR family transcriptional repressor of nem operon
MPIATKSARGAATRDQILDAAGRLIHLRGYHATSLDDVLKESGVGKGNFYYYFKSKEELAYAIIDRVVQDFAERTLEPAFADPAADPIEQIEDLLGRIVEGHRERNGAGGNLACELSEVHEGFRQRLAGVFTLWHVRMAEALAGGQRTGQLRSSFDPTSVAEFVVAALEGAILMTKVTREMAVMERCVAELKSHLTIYRATER